MNYEGFKKIVEENFIDYLPVEMQGAKVEIKKIQKINRTLDGLTLVSLDSKINVSPTIYIQNLYNRYQRNNDMDMTLRQAAEDFMEAMISKDEIDSSLCLNNAKDNIVFQVINTLQNEDMLRDMPHREFLDLSIIYRWVIKVDENGMQSSPVNNDLAKKIGMNEGQLFKAAVENTRRIFPPTIMPIMDIVREMCIRDGMPAEYADEMFGEIPDDMMLWVVTNQQRLNGASSMLYDECLKDLSEKLGSDLYIIPSSVHEVIAVNSNAKDPEELADMVYEINRGQVPLEDRLSNQIYYYDRINRKLTIAINSVENIA